MHLKLVNLTYSPLYTAKLMQMHKVPIGTWIVFAAVFAALSSTPMQTTSSATDHSDAPTASVTTR